ncbi:porin family protein [Pseudomonas asiatica]|uniref:hypothetical protein n=1 Tax=Pseudomonas asiatica TaxID=2219225 RepID=UPI003839F2CB
MHKIIKKIVYGAVLLNTVSAQALELYKDDTRALDLNLELTAIPIFSSFHYGDRRDKNVNWMESYIRASLVGEQAAFGGKAYGGLGVISSKVLGDGDAAGTSEGDEHRTNIDTAFAGWKNDWIDVSAGRQNYVLGDYFLIAGDQLNYGKRIGNGFDRGGLYYSSQRTTFSNTAIARIKPVDSLMLEAFHLESDNNGQGNPIMNGVNTEYSPFKATTLGLSYFKFDNVDGNRADGLFSARKDMEVYNIRGKSDFGVAPLTARFGYAQESSPLVDANAWYVGADYNFSQWPTSPTLGYRYAKFSGDKGDGGKGEAFDPLFYGASNTDPEWVQGEVTGTFAGPFNSDMRSHRVSANFTLTDTTALKVKAYRFSSERGDEHLADEVDFYLEWFPRENLIIVPIVGFWKPASGGQERYGTDNSQTFASIIASLTF